MRHRRDRAGISIVEHHTNRRRSETVICSATLSVVLTGAGAVNVKAGQCVGTHAVEEESRPGTARKLEMRQGHATLHAVEKPVVAAQKDHRQANWIKVER
jgi:hypothetical protein